MKVMTMGLQKPKRMGGLFGHRQKGKPEDGKKGRRSLQVLNVAVFGLCAVLIAVSYTHLTLPTKA